MYLIYKLWYTTIKNSKWFFFFSGLVLGDLKKKKKKILGNLKGHSMGVVVSILEPKGVLLSDYSLPFSLEQWINSF